MAVGVACRGCCFAANNTLLEGKGVSEAIAPRGALLLETGVVSVVAFVVVGVCVYVCAPGAGSEAYTERLGASSTSVAVVAVAVAVMLAAPKGGWPFPLGGTFWQLVHRQFAPQ